ncbi:hypothetical protein RJ640_028271 [Escallonia rubra]|uniref:O-fucosyltransferase family protein n=1 Tax=Escallonia rubra TaxID=112253 RepID=A0AA88RKU1_9ASTE|nr:hypothetical protein RJ640_028271 [Escallonia rubra]
MKGEGKMVFKSKLKWVGLVGLVLSAFSLFTHFLLARYTDGGFSEYPSAITIFSWRPVFEDVHLSIANPLYRRLWGPVRRLESLHPLPNPRGGYAEGDKLMPLATCRVLTCNLAHGIDLAPLSICKAPCLRKRSQSKIGSGMQGTEVDRCYCRPYWSLPMVSKDQDSPADWLLPVLQTTGFIFVRIRGGFHEIRNSICDAVVIARLLNATLVIPEIQSTTSSKGISSEFKSFAYLYNEDQFMAALSKDVSMIKTLPKNLKGARRKKEIPSFKVPCSASPFFYLRHVLPVLNKHSVVELVVSDGGCLQAILPPNLEEYQRLRCRVAFHALRFRQEVQELATRTLNRLRAPGWPFIAYETLGLPETI